MKQMELTHCRWDKQNSTATLESNLTFFYIVRQTFTSNTTPTWKFKTLLQTLLSKSLENHDISMKFHIMTIKTQRIRTYEMLHCPEKN